MKAVHYFLMVLAFCGLALSLAVHGMALADITIPGGKLVWGLHIGVFVVWIPLMLTSSQTMRHAQGKDFWKVALAGCPVWMRRAGKILFCYVILNFVVFLVTMSDEPKATLKEVPSPSVVRGFSGHWLVLYWVAFALLYSRIHSPPMGRERQCPLGHGVMPDARYCPKCGHDFSGET